jgi:Uma2 family endonuclease
MTEAIALLPAIGDQHAFNVARWDELMADPQLAALDYRIETDRFGQILMAPPPGLDHSLSQGGILDLLRQHAPPGGRCLPECPVSTSAGVKAADAVWISEGRLVTARKGSVLVTAPEICIEVLSPSNHRDEIAEKKELYFAAGADEVWVCGLDGGMSFYRSATPTHAEESSLICPGFPSWVR